MGSRTTKWIVAASACAAWCWPLAGYASPAVQTQGQAPPAAAAPAQQSETAQVTNVGGRWELNWQQSDRPPENFGAPGGERGGDRQGGRRGGAGGGGIGGRGGMGGRGGGMGRGEGSERGAETAREEMRQFLEAPRTLLIVEHPDRVSITDENGQVQKLTPDGNKVKEEREGRTIERRAHWDGRALISEVTLSNGARITQTFQKVAEGLQLVVTTKVEAGRMGRPLELKRVYDQALQ